MTDTLLNDPVVIDSIYKAADELLHRQNKEQQTLEQRLESVEQKVEFLLNSLQKPFTTERIL